MISLFLLNLFLALVYVLLTEDTSVSNLLIGLVIGYVVTALTSVTVGKTNYALKIVRLLWFLLYFIKILVEANWQVAREVVTPGYQMQPRLIRYDVTGMSPAQITTLASAITLPPGTLSADINDEGDTLFIHCMYAGEKAEAVEALDDLKFRMLRDVFDYASQSAVVDQEDAE